MSQGNLQPGDAAAADRLFACREGQRGTLVYIAGQVSSDASGKLVGEGNFEAQAEQVFKNLKLAIEAAGATMADIVKMNTYLVAEVDPGRCAEDAGGPRPLHQHGKAAGQHARGGEPAGAAGLADRDRGRRARSTDGNENGARERAPSRLADSMREVRPPWS